MCVQRWGTQRKPLTKKQILHTWEKKVAEKKKDIKRNKANKANKPPSIGEQEGKVKREFLI